MSKILVKKALELVQLDLQSDSKRVDNKSLSVQNKRVNKQKRSLPSNASREINRFLTVDKRIKSSIDGFKKNNLVDRTEENLKILQQLRSLKPKEATAKKLIDFYCKKPEKKKKEVYEPKSILFPEENKKKKRKKR